MQNLQSVAAISSDRGRLWCKQPTTHRPAATLSNVKGKRDAPSLPATVTCLQSTQTNRSEPTMCVSGMPGAQSCKCSCEVTFSQPKHSFVIMVATPFWNSGEVRMRVLGARSVRIDSTRAHQRHCHPSD